TQTGLSYLLNGLKSNDVQLRSEAVYLVENDITFDARIASQLLQPLLDELKDNAPKETYRGFLDVSESAAWALGEVARANPSLASKMLQPLLDALKDNDYEVCVAAGSTLSKVVRSDPSLAGRMLQPLLDALKDRKRFVRLGAASALGGVARA